MPPSQKVGVHSESLRERSALDPVYGEKTSILGGQGDANFAHNSIRLFQLKFIWFDFTKCYSKSEETNSFCPSVP